MKLTPEDLKEILDAVPVDEVGGEREYSVFSNYIYKFAITPAQWFLTKETHKPLDCAQLERSMYMSESLQLISCCFEELYRLSWDVWVVLRDSELGNLCLKTSQRYKGDRLGIFILTQIWYE